MTAQNRPLTTQVTITSSGVAYQGPDIAAWHPAEQGGGFFVRFMFTSTGYGYAGNNGSGATSSGQGFDFDPGAQTFITCNNLNEVWFTATVDGAKFSCLKA